MAEKRGLVEVGLNGTCARRWAVPECGLLNGQPESIWATMKRPSERTELSTNSPHRHAFEADPSVPSRRGRKIDSGRPSPCSGREGTYRLKAPMRKRSSPRCANT
jgi:hypothetical protein